MSREPDLSMPQRDAAPTPPILPDVLGVALGRLQAALVRLKAAADRRHPAPTGLAGQEASTALREAHATALERLGRAEATLGAVMQALAADAAEAEDLPPEPPEAA